MLCGSMAKLTRCISCSNEIPSATNKCYLRQDSVMGYSVTGDTENQCDGAVECCVAYSVLR